MVLKGEFDLYKYLEHLRDSNVRPAEFYQSIFGHGRYPSHGRRLSFEVSGHDC